MELDFQVGKMDLISDMISRIKTAINVKKTEILIRKSNHCIQILKVLQRLGYINYFIIQDNKIKIKLKYKNNKSVIFEIKRISTSGSRIYLNCFGIKKILKKNYGFFLISTSKGIKIDIESVLLNTGGEVLLYIR